MLYDIVLYIYDILINYVIVFKAFFSSNDYVLADYR